MALMTTSGSMPFSFASASIVCCNGFDMFTPGAPTPRSSRLARAGPIALLRFAAFTPGPQPPFAASLKIHFQIGPRDHIERHTVTFVILPIDDHGVAVDAGQNTLEEALPVHLLAHDQLRPAAGEPCVIAGGPHWRSEAGRRNLERVRHRHHVLHVEDGAQFTTHAGAVVHAYALFRRRCRTGSVDLHPQHHAVRLPPEPDVENVEPVARSHPLGHGPDPSGEVS